MASEPDRRAAPAAHGDGDGLRDLLRGLPVFAGQLPEFDPAAAPDDPVALFGGWLAEAVAAGEPEPHVMTLSTADARGRPSSRALICKDVDAAGNWYFASGARSRKGRELAENPQAALAFYWPGLGRQIRIAGAVTAAGPRASAADFLARSAGGRAESLTGRQSEVLADPADLRGALGAARACLEADPQLVAPDWTLYALAATEAEFWQADREREHIRLRYRREHGAGWRRDRLWP
jgi:pyridoxamine 5'-phosphate oxidase